MRSRRAGTDRPSGRSGQHQDGHACQEEPPDAPGEGDPALDRLGAGGRAAVAHPGILDCVPAIDPRAGEAQAQGSPFLRQYAPGQPGSIARPGELPGTDLTNAFVQQTAGGPAPAPAPAPGPAPAPPPTPAGFGYGFQVHMWDFSQQGKDLIAGQVKLSGFNWVKQQVEWFVLEREPGQYDWRELDAMGISRWDKRALNAAIGQLVDPLSPTHLSDAGLRELNKYSYGGFAVLTEWFDEAPRVFEALLPLYKRKLDDATAETAPNLSR